MRETVAHKHVKQIHEILRQSNPPVQVRLQSAKAYLAELDDFVIEYDHEAVPEPEVAETEVEVVVEAEGGEDEGDA